MNLVAYKLCQGCDGGEAVAIEAGDEGALEIDTLSGGGMIERVEELLGCQIVAAALDGECALAGVGEEMVEGNGMHEGGVEEVGAFEAGEGEDDGVEVAVSALEFADAGVDVAADVLEFQIGAEGEELTAAAEGAGADFGIRWASL